MFGLCPDEFGYLVPKYDWRREPVDLKRWIFRQSPDACKRRPGDQITTTRPTPPSPELAPASACVTVALLTGKAPTDAACVIGTGHSRNGPGMS
jgi:hypothetical protein